MTSFKLNKIKDLNNFEKPKVEEKPFVKLAGEKSIQGKVLGCDPTCDFPDVNGQSISGNDITIPTVDSIQTAFDNLITEINLSLDTLASNDVRLYNDLDNIHSFLGELVNGLSQTFGCFCQFELPTLEDLCPSPCSSPDPTAGFFK